MRTVSAAIAAVLVLAAAQTGAAAPRENVRETPVVRAIRAASPSVVNIGTERIISLRGNPYLEASMSFDDFFRRYAESVEGTVAFTNLGSGVVVASDGIIATNAHVVQMASRIIVTMSDGMQADATLLGVDSANDIALVRVEAPVPLKPLDFADDVLIGETVVAIGDPFGLQNSVSAGIVSGTGRSFTAYPANHAFKDLVQTDAAINPGNSGGALINLEGKLVGVNLAVVQNAQGIGFAVPASKVRAMLEEYRRVSGTAS